MKKIIVLMSLVTSFHVFAAEEATEFMIKGMHCSGCKKMITKTVCDDKDLATQFAECKVDLVDASKEIGKITIKMKPGQTLDQSKLSEAVKKAGPDYSVIPASDKK